MKTITKVTLYFRAMKTFFIIGIALGAFMVTMIAVIPLFVDNPLELRESAAMGVFSVAASLLIFIVIGSLHILRGFFRIAEQERFFGFRFRDEMQSSQISKIDHVCKNWFISASAAGVIVFRKGFITRINKVERYYRHAVTSRIVVTVASGSKLKVVGHSWTIDRLLKWQGVEESDTGANAMEA